MKLSIRLSPWLLACLLAALLFVGLDKARVRAEWPQKVDAALLEAAAAPGETEFLVVLAVQADLRQAAQMGSKEARGSYVYARLTAVAERTQGPLLATLQAAGATYRPYWVSNMIWVRGDGRLLEQLARRADVARVEANPWVQLDTVAVPPNAPADAQEGAGVEWSINLVGAPQVWAAGATGQGVVVGGQDTGYDWQHPALINQYRGWDGVTAVHDYNWHDAIHGDNPNTPVGNPCGFDSPDPCDDDGHGTHTMGTMVGDDGAANQIGMAPDAEWIACRNMEQGWGTPATYAECYEWFIAPYPAGGDPFNDGDPARAPHVIGNSWSCPVSEGCTNPDVLRQVVNNVRAAGILTVHAASNSGPFCSSIDTPAAIYDASYTVAATDNSDMVAGFSSRGPVLLGDNRPAKPDISAPGVGIRASLPGGGYGFKSGTSMATPHVVGLVALLISAAPELAGDVDAIEGLINQTAVARTTTDGCGGDTAQSHPNHTYGWGRIDAYEAFLALDDPDLQPTPTNTPLPTGTLETPTPSPTGTAMPPAYLNFTPLWLSP